MTGADLKAARIAAGLSQRQMAALVGVHHSTVQFWERQAKVDLLAWGMRRIAKALGLRNSTPDHTYARARLGVLRDSQETNIALIDCLYFNRRNRRPRNILICRVVCEARTRKGKPCRAKSEPGKQRCRLHGGKSTGPKTPEGRERIAAAQRRRWVKFRLERKCADNALPN